MANFDPAFDKMIRNEGGFKLTNIEGDRGLPAGRICTAEDPLHCEASMNQEDLNALMRNPWEAAKKPRPQPLPECPQCGERYCGDGIAFCTECANTVTPNAPAQPTAPGAELSETKVGCGRGSAGAPG